MEAVGNAKGNNLGRDLVATVCSPSTPSETINVLKRERHDSSVRIRIVGGGVFGGPVSPTPDISTNFWWSSVFVRQRPKLPSMLARLDGKK